jgi:two-component system cell cycle response regulator
MLTPHRRRTELDTANPVLRALIVDEDPAYRASVGNLLQRLGFVVTGAAEQRDLLAAIEGSPFDLLLIASEMPSVDLSELIATVRGHRRTQDAYAVVVIEADGLDASIEALRAGFDDAVERSADEQELVQKLAVAHRMMKRQRRLDATIRELYGLATRDELTGVFNRRYFFSEAERLLAAGAEVSLVLFDLDGFKQVNDTYGHLSGDRILRDIGALFLSRTRNEDIIARYGGDEFVMLVSSAVKVAEMLASRLSDEVANMKWIFGDDTVQVGMTTGIASSALLSRPTISQLLSAADRDLYKNKWVRSHPSLDPDLYVYPTNRASHISELVEFPSRKLAVPERASGRE